MIFDSFWHIKYDCWIWFQFISHGWFINAFFSTFIFQEFHFFNIYFTSLFAPDIWNSTAETQYSFFHFYKLVRNLYYIYNHTLFITIFAFLWRLLPRWDIYSEQISYDNDHENCNPQRDFDLSPILELNKYSLYFTNYPYEIGIKFESLDTKILLYEYILINSLAKRVICYNFII